MIIWLVLLAIWGAAIMAFRDGGFFHFHLPRAAMVALACPMMIAYLLVISPHWDLPVSIDFEGHPGLSVDFIIPTWAWAVFVGLSLSAAITLGNLHSVGTADALQVLNMSSMGAIMGVGSALTLWAHGRPYLALAAVGIGALKGPLYFLANRLTDSTGKDWAKQWPGPWARGAMLHGVTLYAGLGYLFWIAR
jgi:hypothetical protein